MVVAFMDSHLTSQSSTIFRSVHSLIYIFDAESPDLNGTDTHYFLKCLGALRDQNPSSLSESTILSPLPPSDAETQERENTGPMVFILLHKMDLVPSGSQASKLAEFSADVRRKASESGWKGENLRFFGTSIWDETLYKVSPLPYLTLNGTDERVGRHGQ